MYLLFTDALIAYGALAVSALTAIGLAYMRTSLARWGAHVSPAAKEASGHLENAGRMAIDETHRQAGDLRAAKSTPSWAGQNCSIMLIDIARFAAPHRTDADRLTMRHAMYRILKEACDRSGIPWQGCHHEDRGDGVLMIIPPATPTCRIVHPLLAFVLADLGRHNREGSHATRIQLRVSLHVGPVTSDSEGVSGEAIIHTARLLDAPVLKRRLARANADVGFITSSFVFDNIVKHAPGSIDPAAYRHVTLRLKESRLPAWIHLARA